MPLYQIDIYPREDQVDRPAARTADQIEQMGLGRFAISQARSFLIQGKIDRNDAERLATELLADGVVEIAVTAPCGDDDLAEPPIDGDASVVHVLPKPGVMDPVAASTLAAARDAGFDIDGVRTMRKYWIADIDESVRDQVCRRVLANDAIEHAVAGPLSMDRLDVGSSYEFELVTVNIRSLDDGGLERLSREGQLYLTLVEMRTIRDHFESIGRDPTDIELESIAQTWSEHCSHKTLAGRIDYRGPSADGTPGGDHRRFDNMLKETIFAATQTIRKNLGDDDWCVSVFKDNAGVVKFDEKFHACFKVETHNHPSALEPYGGASTGIGGVIRDPMGTGMGARPVCNTDVFCFASPDTPTADLPPGVLHPRRVMQGVVSGVRDYGNRMGIPTVNGAVVFDDRYLGNPLVYCGNAGMIPVGMEEKAARPGDYIVTMGGRTGRDGIHGATFSSAELTSESESLSGGAVQIGNPVTEKMVLDVLLQARDQGLFSAVTDCGAGGFSSAVGEMGEDIGAEVHLEKAPLKYDGLSYTEIWISEAQERMVLSVPPEKWDTLQTLCAGEGVEVARIGHFTDTGRLVLSYHGHNVGDVSMAFLHGGRPPIIRDATFDPPVENAMRVPEIDANQTLLNILASPNVASKHWIIRQYDHEVQGGSVVKPIVGVGEGGPGDAAVIRPEMHTRRGLVFSCGINPRYGDLDPYHMAASAIDEAVRNAVAVGADPTRIAILDNFCWGYTDRPETLGSLVRAAIACQDLAVELATPFVSGKDSLNNEFSYEADGETRTISIPATLLISAMGQIDDVSNALTMDLKHPGSTLYLVGQTHVELGGSHLGLVHDIDGGHVPKVDAAVARQTFAAMHAAIQHRWIRSCHDLSEGGLAVAVAESAFAGGLGVELTIAPDSMSPVEYLFSESNTRFLIEVTPAHCDAIENHFDSAGITLTRLGQTTHDPTIRISHDAATILKLANADTQSAWRNGLSIGR